MNKYMSRITSSARGETFNFLIWPFLLTTVSYGVGFALVYPFFESQASSLHGVMYDIAPWLPLVWGISCLVVIATGLIFLLFNRPPWGKFSGLLGFVLWSFAAACYGMAMNFVVLFAVAIPQSMFWGWQWINLRRLRDEDIEDEESMEDFDQAGGYQRG